MSRAALLFSAFALALAPTASADDSGGRVVRVIHNPPGDAPILGPRYAAVTIEFFFQVEDYQAAKVHRGLVELAKRHPLRLRIVYRPLQIRVDRLGANTLAMESFRQGLFHEFLEAFYKTSSPRRNELEKVAAEIGLDWKAFKTARQRGTHDAALRANEARARRFALNNPRASILVNGEPVSRVRGDVDTLEILYDTAYTRAKLILAAGYPVSQLYGRILRKRTADAKVPRITIGAIDGRVRRRPKKNGLPLTGAIDYSGPYTIGPKGAPVVIVSFCRFASRNCRDQFREVSRTVAAFEGEVRHVFKPLYDPIEDPYERRVHMAAECAADQGAFWEYLEQALNYNTRLRSDESKIRQAFSNLNLDDDQFGACLDSERHTDKVAAQLVEAVRVGVNHTPSTVIGGRIYIGKPTLSNLMKLVELELAPGMLGSWLETGDEPRAKKPQDGG